MSQASSSPTATDPTIEALLLRCDFELGHALAYFRDLRFQDAQLGQRLVPVFWHGELMLRRFSLEWLECVENRKRRLPT